MSRWRQHFRDVIFRCHVGNLRVAGVMARSTLQDAARRWHRPVDSPANRLWAEYMAGTVMLGSFYKGEERIKLTFRSQVVREVYVEAMAAGEVRGKIDLLNSNVQQHLPLQKGQMQIAKILYGATKPYVTTVEAIGHPEADWQRFYDVSEQIPTIVRINSAASAPDSVQCCGLTIQKMPDSAPHDRHYELADLRFEQNELHAQEIENHDQMLDYLNKLIPNANLTEEGCRKVPLDFFCRCSKQNYAKRLQELGATELERVMHDTRDQGIDLTCHFCNDAYHFSAQELQSIMTTIGNHKQQ